VSASVKERMMAGFEITAVEGIERTEIRCGGELDVGQCAKLIETFDQALAREVERVVVDLRGVTFIDSTGIGCLLHGASKADKLHVAFEVIPGPAVERFVKVSGLSPYLAMD
jgi:anti-sigma B factor antagonist